jgi:hypothetical protein
MALMYYESNINYFEEDDEINDFRRIYKKPLDLKRKMSRNVFRFNDNLEKSGKGKYLENVSFLSGNLNTVTKERQIEIKNKFNEDVVLKLCETDLDDLNLLDAETINDKNFENVYVYLII